MLEKKLSKNSLITITYDRNVLKFITRCFYWYTNISIREQLFFFNLLIMMFQEKKKIFIKWTKQQKITAYTIQDKNKMVSRYTCTNNLSCLSEKIIIHIKIFFIMFFTRKNKLEGLCKTENSPQFYNH